MGLGIRSYSAKAPWVRPVGIERSGLRVTEADRFVVPNGSGTFTVYRLQPYNLYANKR
jgi:hypothetical protein